MDNELEVIRDEMELTRSNLADKLGALETQVRETVSDAREAVSSTVEGVKEVVGSVSETVGSVTEQLSITKQVENHPWLAVGAAVAAGFAAGQVLGHLSNRPAALGAPQPLSSQSSTSSHAARSPAAKQGGALESMMPDLGGVMDTMLSRAGGLAVNSLFGMIRELTSRGLPPEWQGEVTKLVDQVASQLGGKPIDPSRSSQLLDVLGLGEKKEEEKAREEPKEPSHEPRQEGAPYEAARQPVGVGNGPQGGWNDRFTTR